MPEFFHVDATFRRKAHSLLFQQCPLPPWSAKNRRRRHAAKTVHNPVARQGEFLRGRAQRIADNTRGTSAAKRFGNLAIGHYLAFRNAGHKPIYSFKI